MEHISELLTGLTDILENQVRTRITSNMPDTPIAIVYAGEKAFEAQEEIQNTLKGIWRGRTEGICQFLMRGDGYCLPEKDGSVTELQEDVLQEKMDEMFALEQSFRTMNGMLLCQILDTADYATMEAFEKGYRAPDKLKEQLGMSFCSIMKIVMLDESGKGRALAKEIKETLRTWFINEDEATQATIILSNRLKNGVLLAGERIRENYALAGNLIVLANGSNGVFAPKMAQMFPIRQPHFVTASYSCIRKPNKKICEILINTVLSWLESRFNEGELLSTDIISQRLNITAGVMKAIEECFQQNVAEVLPGREALEYLPRNSADLESIGARIFAEFDRITMGSFALFYKDTFHSVCNSKAMRNLFRERFAEEVRRQITPREAARSFTAQTVEQVLGQLRYDAPSDRKPAYQYMIEKVKADFCEQVIPICDEVMQSYGAESKNHIQQITEVVQEFQHNYMLGVDETLKSYYQNLVTEKLESGLGDPLLRVFNQTGLTKAKMLEAVYDTISLLFTSNPIFGMPLEDELTARMGGNGKQVQTIIQEELTNGLGERVRLQTSIVPEISFETILVNQKSEKGETGMLYQHLAEIFGNAECLDTGNSNSIEFIQMYSVDPHTI